MVLVRSWTTALALAFLLVVPAGFANAHSDLKSIDPPDGSTLESAPTQVVLNFTADVLGDFTQITVTGPTGAVSTTAPVSIGNTVTQALPELSSGTYTLAFRIVSADSHPITGQSTFSIAQGNAPTSAEASPSTPMNASPTAMTATSPASSNSASADTSAGQRDGASSTTATVLVVTMAAALVGGFTWFTRRRRQ